MTSGEVVSGPYDVLKGTKRIGELIIEFELKAYVRNIILELILHAMNHGEP